MKKTIKVSIAITTPIWSSLPLSAKLGTAVRELWLGLDEELGLLLLFMAFLMVAGVRLLWWAEGAGGCIELDAVTGVKFCFARAATLAWRVRHNASLTKNKNQEHQNLLSHVCRSHHSDGSPAGVLSWFLLQQETYKQQQHYHHTSAGHLRWGEKQVHSLTRVALVGKHCVVHRVEPEI